MSSDTKFAVNSRLPPNSIPLMLITWMLYVTFYSNRIQFRKWNYVYIVYRWYSNFSSFPLFEETENFRIVDILSVRFKLVTSWLIGFITEDVSFKRGRMEYFYRD